MMSSSALILQIQQLDGKRYVKITRKDKVERLILTKLIKKQTMIVGRATTCWMAYRDGDESKEPLIVKDSWQYEERPEEGELIQATKKGVRNVARYYHHETFQVDGKNNDISENVRREMMRTCGRTLFKQELFIEPKSPSLESLGKAVAGPFRVEVYHESDRQVQPRWRFQRERDLAQGLDQEIWGRLLTIKFVGVLSLVMPAKPSRTQLRSWPLSTD